MNTNSQIANTLVDTIVKGSRHYCDSVQMVVLPPFPYLVHASERLKDTALSLGAQSVSEHGKGAYTGEVSASMLKDVGVNYVLVGHSERRGLYGECNSTVAAKFAAVQAAGLTPMLCVGETLVQRQAEVTIDIVTSQLQAVIEHLGIDALKNAVVAYEPVWAIGTGHTASPQQAQEVHKAMRDYIATQNATVAQKLTILYGGSVTAESAEALFSEQDIDGGLVGGAALQADSFLAIGEAAYQASQWCGVESTRANKNKQNQNFAPIFSATP